MTTAFVLGGGGQLGAHQVGMLRALIERGITPELIVATSIDASVVDRLTGRTRLR